MKLLIRLGCRGLAYSAIGRNSAIPDVVDFPPELIRKLHHAYRLVVLTGSGISAESGIPTFRDAQTGLWASYRPEDLATPEAFTRNPRLVWEWYAWRRELISNALPNPGHQALTALEKRLLATGSSFTIITQNVDGLHQKAGSHSVLELHGNIMRIKCADEGIIVTSWNEDDVPPLCPRCLGYLRPDVVWFGETLPETVLSSAMLAARQCDVFLSIGTSALVYPAASLPGLALDHGAFVVEINLETTPLTPFASCSIRGRAAQILPALLEAAWS